MEEFILFFSFASSVGGIFIDEAKFLNVSLSVLTAAELLRSDSGPFVHRWITISVINPLKPEERQHELSAVVSGTVLSHQYWVQHE